MAKGQQRTNRETKKPKQDKVKTAKETPSPFTVVPSKTVGSVKPNTGKR
jgi:hypothetical protein